MQSLITALRLRAQGFALAVGLLQEAVMNGPVSYEQEQQKEANRLVARLTLNPETL